MTSERESGSPIDWAKVKRFNFTYAIPGGAWLEFGPFITSDGMKPYIEWFSFTQIEKRKGNDWIQRHLKKQGWMTGCWVDCEVTA